MVEFCPKCGTLMVPARRGGKAFLVCKRCGYSKPASSKGYRRTESIPEEKKTKFVVVESHEEEAARLEEERELLREYYEVFLRTMEESEE